MAAHSRGSYGPATPDSCQPIPYLGSLGPSDVRWQFTSNPDRPVSPRGTGATITTMPARVHRKRHSQMHELHAVAQRRIPLSICSFDGPHTASPTDAGKSTSWMPRRSVGLLEPVLGRRHTASLFPPQVVGLCLWPVLSTCVRRQSFMTPPAAIPPAVSRSNLRSDSCTVHCENTTSSRYTVPDQVLSVSK